MKRNAKSSHSSKKHINAENIKLPTKTIGKHGVLSNTIKAQITKDVENI
jgi:hypothetical protein